MSDRSVNGPAYATIRWKPYMWWIYFEDDATSHIHGEVEDLKEMVGKIYPNCKVDVDYPSFSSKPKTE